MTSVGLRRRVVGETQPKPDIFESIRSLDAFTKVTEEAEAPKTLTGGFFSALAFTGNTVHCCFKSFKSITNYLQ